MAADQEHPLQHAERQAVIRLLTALHLTAAAVVVLTLLAYKMARLVAVAAVASLLALVRLAVQVPRTKVTQAVKVVPAATQAVPAAAVEVQVALDRKASQKAQVMAVMVWQAALLDRLYRVLAAAVVLAIAQPEAAALLAEATAEKAESLALAQQRTPAAAVAVVTPVATVTAARVSS